MPRQLVRPYAPAVRMKRTLRVSEGGTGGTSPETAAAGLSMVALSEVGTPNGVAVLENGVLPERFFTSILNSASGSFSIDGPKKVTVGSVSTYTISNADSFMALSVTASQGVVSSITDSSFVYTAPNTPSSITLTINGRQIPVSVVANQAEKPSILVPSDGVIGIQTNTVIRSSRLCTSGVALGAVTQITANDPGITIPANAVGVVLTSNTALAADVNVLVDTENCLFPDVVTNQTVSLKNSISAAPVMVVTGVNSPAHSGAVSYRWRTPTDTHVSSDWQLATDPDFTQIVAQTNADTVNKTSWNPPLLENTLYYVRVRHNTQNYGASAWSDTVAFETKSSLYPAVQEASFTEGQSATTFGNANSQTVAMSGDGNWMASFTRNPPDNRNLLHIAHRDPVLGWVDYAALTESLGVTADELGLQSINPDDPSYNNGVFLPISEVSISNDGSVIAVTFAEQTDKVIVYTKIFKRINSTYAMTAKVMHGETTLTKAISHKSFLSGNGRRLAIVSSDAVNVPAGFNFAIRTGEVLGNGTWSEIDSAKVTLKDTSATPAITGLELSVDAGLLGVSTPSHLQVFSLGVSGRYTLESSISRISGAKKLFSLAGSSGYMSCGEETIQNGVTIFKRTFVQATGKFTWQQDATYAYAGDGFIGPARATCLSEDGTKLLVGYDKARVTSNGTDWPEGGIAVLLTKDISGWGLKTLLVSTINPNTNYLNYASGVDMSNDGEFAVVNLNSRPGAIHNNSKYLFKPQS